MSDKRLPRRAVLYCRISDARNGDDHGVAGQEKRLRDHADRLAWGVGKVVVENDTSAFKRRKITLPDGRRALRVIRPGWREMLDDLATGRADGLLALDLDRACRDPRDLEDLIDVVEATQPRLPVESVTGSLRLANDGDITNARVLVAVANKASRDTSRRVADARRHHAEAGEYKAAGPRPFGFERDGITPRPDEMAELRKVADDILAGVSMRQVIASLRQRGVPTIRGGQWETSTVRDILTRPRMAGLLVYRGEVVDGVKAPWEPVIPVEKWRTLVALLNDPDRRTSPGNRPAHLGSLLYECGHDEHNPDDLPTMRASRRPDHGTFVYRCSERNHCTRSLELLDKFVLAVMGERLSREDAADLLLPKATVDTVALEKQAAALRARRKEAVDLWQAGVLTKGELMRRDEELRGQIADLEQRIGRGEERSPLAGLAGRPDARARLAELDLGRQRAALRALMRVIVLPGARGRMPDGSRFDPDGVEIIWK